MPGARTVLQTERLVLRPLERGDAGALHAYQSREDVARYHFWEPRSLADIHEKLDDWTKMTSMVEGNTLACAICRFPSGDLIGDISLRVTDTEAGQAEIGFSLNPDYQGYGYAREAAAAFLQYAFDEVGLHRVFGRCDARNLGSWKLMESLGMRREAHFREHAIFKGGWDEEFYYAILEREWQASADTAHKTKTLPGFEAGKRQAV